MKKIWLTFVSTVIALMVTAVNVSAAQFSNGKEYQKLARPVSSEPEVLEFFSFYCHHCYDFEQVFHVPQFVKAALPADTKITRYHVAFLGPLGEQLTRAWAVAMVLEIEDKIMPLMFEAVQKTKTVKTSGDIRDIFIKAGVEGEKYDNTLNDMSVNILVLKQSKAAKALDVQGVPVMFVNGKYRVINEDPAMKTSSIEERAKRYAEIVKFLLPQK